MACETDGISEDFVLMNDDFFVTRNLKSVSLYHGGVLHNRYKRHTALVGPNQYASLLLKTHEALRKAGVEEPINYDLHVPMVINKTNMSYVVDEPYSIRSYYGNMFNLGGEYLEDVKIYSSYRLMPDSASVDNDSPYLSTEDGSFYVIKEFVEKSFPNPSPHEYP